MRIEILNSKWLRAALIAGAGAFALIGCFSADFISYDDPAHIDNPAFADAKSWTDYFVPKTNTTYIPLTLLSYKVDRALFGQFSQKLFGSWAPAVRLRFSERRSFFVALIFACHPTACETVCWVSERKNTFAALFGFALLWLQCDPRRKLWHWPVMFILFALALIGKPSALGLLPVIASIEVIALKPALRERFLLADGASKSEVTAAKPPEADPVLAAFTEIESGAKKKTPPSKFVKPSSALPSIVGLAVLALIALGITRANLYTHEDNIVTPPGGNIFTAMLTDLEIFSRYIFNQVFPFSLSAVYFVDPIRGLGDVRVWGYGAALFGTVAVTIFFARNRWRSAFGWIWFFAALGPNANLIAIGHLMQDRYVYLAAPGLWIAFSEFAAGIGARIFVPHALSKFVTAAGIVIALLCAALSASRGYVWRSTFDVFSDAAQRQPQAFYAHYGLGLSLYEKYSHALEHGVPRVTAEIQYPWKREFKTAVECPDSVRWNFTQRVAWILGEDAFRWNDPVNAERYLKIAATKPSEAPDRTEEHALGLAYLSVLDVNRGELETAIEKARESLRLQATENGQFALASALVALVKKQPQGKSALIEEARAALAKISTESSLHRDADALATELAKLH